MEMFAFFGARRAYGRAVHEAADRLVDAYGEAADQEAWRAARLTGLAAGEAEFCQAVAECVTRKLGKAPGMPVR
ncbi:MAG: hypothetical protein KDJ83_01610 [Rhodobacteraceae bacterium]|nr:hypothetical protein [Paracoccaceae bacterium]